MSRRCTCLACPPPNISSSGHGGDAAFRGYSGWRCFTAVPLNFTVRLPIVRPTIARQGRKANRQTRHSGTAQVALKRTAGRWVGSWWGGRAGVRRGARLTSVPADRLSSPSRTARGRDRRRLNIAVRPASGTLCLSKKTARRMSCRCGERLTGVVAQRSGGAQRVSRGNARSGRWLSSFGGWSRSGWSARCAVVGGVCVGWGWRLGVA